MMGAARRAGVTVACVALCAVAWAGNVAVSVAEGPAPVPGANVRIEPGTITGSTDIHGKWNATGVAAGEAIVMAWTDVGGTLRGAVATVTVPANGNVAVDLSLVPAIWIDQYFPHTVGNRWQYEHRHAPADGASSRGIRREQVDRSITIAGEPAVVVVATNDGVYEWEEIRASSRNGFVMYTQQHGADTIKFSPPLRFGALMPQGYEWVVRAVGLHSDGSPDTPLTFYCKLEGFDDVTVPAGSFPQSARIGVRFVAGGETESITTWMAQNVGIVR